MGRRTKTHSGPAGIGEPLHVSVTARGGALAGKGVAAGGLRAHRVAGEALQPSNEEQQQLTVGSGRRAGRRGAGLEQQDGGEGGDGGQKVGARLSGNETCAVSGSGAWLLTEGRQG
jgi:hypothetical protein